MTDLVGLERAAYSRAPDRVTLLYRCLRAFALGKLLENAAQPESVIAQEVMIRRLVSATGAVMADPTTIITPAEMDRLIVLAPELARMFEIAGTGGTDFIFRALAGSDLFSSAILAARLPLLNLDTQIAWPPEFLAGLPPHVCQQALAQLVASKPIMSPRAQTRLDRLLEFAPDMPPGDFPRTPDHLVLISAAWMLCSYSGTPGKHGIKHLFNRTLRAMAEGWGFSDAALPAVRPRKDRPRILFASEIMHSKHVQYRYFGQYLRQLGTRFELVLLTEQKEVDEAVASLFDRVLTFDRAAPHYLGEIYRMMIETAPDILFYPSIGMRHWGPLFANLRLAPIQLTALGHSASSFCDTIDYYLLEEGYVSDPGLFGETVITIPDDSLVFERMPNFTPPPPHICERPDILRIVLPSNLLKLNPAFLATVSRIAKATERRLEFHLLPNARGTEFAALRIAVQRMLPGARLHPSLPYDKYIALLSSGDINLSPFPFGGLHSVVDSLRQGVPVVAMECPEPHGRTDAMLLRRLGMPEWLIATNEDEYVAAALRLVEDDALRVELSRQALAIDVGAVMFGDASTPLRSEIVDAMWWLYQNHEKARTAGRKLWSVTDRLGAPAS
ncbi:MAG TPA: hypothetical protein VNT42_04515 [Sphingomonas sp.]|nr:hypothetical protein [Sphingomonas sp.]